MKEFPMQSLLKDVLALAAARHNTLTVATLRANGITSARQRELVASGVLQRICDGVYRFVGGQPSELALCTAACAHHFGLVVAGPTAGRIWGLRRMPNDHLVHVIAPPHSHPISTEWLKPYRTSMLDPSDIVYRNDGVTLTSPPRTALDLARWLPDDALRSVIDQIEHERMGTAATMRRVAGPLNTRGRPWVGRFLAVLDDRAGGLPRASDGESRVVAALRAKGISAVRSQHWLDVPNFGRICLDAAVLDVCWGVEVDIHPEHWTEVGAAHDRDRDLACDAIGWRVSRAAKLSLDRHFAVTIDRLVAVYRQRCREMGAGDAQAAS
jgi:hypothetical protein